MPLAPIFYHKDAKGLRFSESFLKITAKRKLLIRNEFMDQCVSVEDIAIGVVMYRNGRFSSGSS